MIFSSIQITVGLSYSGYPDKEFFTDTVAIVAI